MRRAIWIAVAALALTPGCHALHYQGTYTCSCSGTGCGCKHCTGESTDCRCRATDAYSNDAIGKPQGR